MILEKNAFPMVSSEIVSVRRCSFGIPFFAKYLAAATDSYTGNPASRTGGLCTVPALSVIMN